jgi:DNA-directed RNA polymerase specialized sigma24 family protein
VSCHEAHVFDHRSLDRNLNRAGGDMDKSRNVLITPDRDYDRTQLEQSIAALPPVFRETLLLRMQGFSYHTISEITGVPIGTVMSRLARARRRLKQMN